ncbi:unnamed protein product [Trichobilharzia regenti]|nr:unnamed protein product [Trichobilharzia regenti]
MKTFTISSATQASTLSRVIKNEVAELRCNLSITRKNLLGVEESLKSSNELVDCLQATNKDSTVKLSASENSCLMKEKEICRLVTQIVELESENKRSIEKIGELECFVESVTGVQKDLEYLCGVFRKQVSKMEAGWLSTSQQQLIKMEELLHMHKSRLLNAEHTSTHESTAKLMKSRIFRKHLMSTTSDVHYYRGNDYRPSVEIILQKMRNRMVKILDIKDHSLHNRHLNKLTINEVSRSSYNNNDPVTNPDFVDNSEISPDGTDENNITESVRRLQRLASKPRHRYKYAKATCGGCGD